MMKNLSVTSILCGVFLTFGCTAKNQPLIVADTSQAHPLLGKIWHPTSGAVYKSSQEFVNQHLPSTDIFLVGELHDNLAHREIQQQLLADLKPDYVGFEAFNRQDQPALDQYTFANQLLQKLEWTKRNWGHHDYFQQFLETAQSQNTHVIGLNLNRDLIRKVAFKGITSLPPKLLNQLELQEKSFLAPAEKESLIQQLEDSHCGMLNREMAEKMLPAQQTRDAIMAWTLTQRHQSKLGLAFVGNEHAQKGRGIPVYAQSYNPMLRILSIHLVEAEADKTTLEDYSNYANTDSVIWFTPRQERPDPCAKYRQAKNKSLKK